MSGEPIDNVRITPNRLDKTRHCLKINKNIYGGKDSGRTWYLHLKAGLEELGFERSTYDECVFYRGSTIFLVYTDDGIILDPDAAGVEKCIADMRSKFILEDQGSIEDYLGVKVNKLRDGTFELTQPHLIDSILIDLQLIAKDGEKLKSKPTTRDLPAMSTKLIGPDHLGKEFEYPWHYRGVIGKLNFLEKSTRCDITYIVHQCARFMESPKQSHGEAIKHLGRYLLKTRDKGYLLKPNMSHSFDCYVDADFCGNWDRTIASEDPDTARSRSGFVIMYAGAPVYWQSKLQTQFALSTAESELLALSAASRYATSLMFLLEELRKRDLPVASILDIHCNLFEDNQATLTIATVPKIRPRTRHLNVIYHHFAGEVANKRLRIHPIDSKNQLADGLTKPLPLSPFLRHRLSIMGW